jgi:predicted transcriptional regulator
MTNEDDESLAEIIASLKEINEAEEQIIKYSRSVLEEENIFISAFNAEKLKKIR